MEHEEFFEVMLSSNSLEKRFSALHNYAMFLGFKDSYYSRLKDPFRSDKYQENNILSLRLGCEQWQRDYKENGHARHDWVIEYAKSRIDPYRLSNIPDNLTEKQQKFLAYAISKNRHNGFAIPFRTACGLVGGFSATGGAELPTDLNIAKLLSAVQYFHMILSSENKSADAQRLEFSEREIQLLELFVSGRSMTQIAHMLGATDQWIRKSFMMMREKAQVGNNSELIYRAVGFNLI
jgi:DNA-binding CsgD family transcriptional regulator